jgi:hypothetical protein
LPYIDVVYGGTEVPAPEEDDLGKEKAFITSLQQICNNYENGLITLKEAKYQLADTAADMSVALLTQ